MFKTSEKATQIKYKTMNKQEKRAVKKLFKKYQTKDITIHDVKKAKKKAKNLKDKVADFKLLLKIIEDVWKGKFSISNKDMAIIVGTIIYVISPIDVIPDFIPVIGWIDDIAVVGWAMKSLKNIIYEYKTQKGLQYC